MLKNFFLWRCCCQLRNILFLFRVGKSKIFILRFQKYINAEIIYQPHWMDKSNMSGKAIWCHLISAFGRDTFLFELLLLQTLSHEFLCQFNISCSSLGLMKYLSLLCVTLQPHHSSFFIRIMLCGWFVHVFIQKNLHVDHMSSAVLHTSMCYTLGHTDE